MANEKNKWVRRHGMWLLILTCFTAGWWVDSWIKDKRQNYKKLWRVQAEIKNRIEAYEEGIKLLYNCCESAVSPDVDFFFAGAGGT